MTKGSQLQIRVTSEQKHRIRRAARDAKTDMSSWVLSRLFPAEENAFQEITARLATAKKPSFALAELNDFLSQLTAATFVEATAARPTSGLSAFLANYVAACVELAAAQKGATPPAWVSEIPPLDAPYFGATLDSLRLHLLTQSPPPFRRRNIFIDSSVGDRL